MYIISGSIAHKGIRFVRGLYNSIGFTLHALFVCSTEKQQKRPDTDVVGITMVKQFRPKIGQKLGYSKYSKLYTKTK
jgi:hypothetical protein